MAQVTFINKPVTLVGPEIKVGDKAPDFTVLSTIYQKNIYQILQVKRY